jgi:hypothetical protein
MAHALLLLDIHIEIADHHYPTVSPDVLLAAAELASGHVALHDIHAVLLIERDAGNLVETDDIVLAHETTLSCGVVHEHLGDRRLTPGNEVRVRRDLLKYVALARSGRARNIMPMVPR